MANIHPKSLAETKPAPGAAPAQEAVAVAEAARRAGVSRSLLYEAIGAGSLPSVKIGKRRLVRVEALRRWLASLETRGT